MGSMTVLATLNESSGRASHDPLPHVLVAEPDLSLASLALEILLGQRCTVTTVPDPRSAIALLWERVFDLVLTNAFATPEALVSTGSEHPTLSLGRCRSVALLLLARETPVILWAAHSVSLAEAQSAGFHDLMPRPVDLEQFEAQVRAVVRAYDLAVSPQLHHTGDDERSSSPRVAAVVFVMPILSVCVRGGAPGAGGFTRHCARLSSMSPS
jgi:CheY-like chemotaxis protein